jgi:hypothetical protein
MDIYMNDVDRRHAVRLEVKGAEVFYKLESGQTSYKPLRDITKSSARFDVDHTIKHGDPIELEIIVPGKVNIVVKGKIIRLSDPASEHPSYAVVQFVPFGTDERYNSMLSYNQLSALIEEQQLTLQSS